MNQAAFDFSGIYGKRSGAYYHTTRLTPEQAREAVSAAKRQQDAILAIYRSRGPLSPADVERICRDMGKGWPIHSIRARITTLADDGALVKLDAHKPGAYGKPEHLWQVAA